MAHKNLVVVQNVRKAFGKNVAVKDVSFQVRGGELFGLLGPNGAGKTTTIRMILDIFKPDAGKIEVFGGPMKAASADRIGYMPEERGLYPEMRVLECLVHLGSLKGMPRSEAREQAQFFLKRLELADQQRARIKDLSRGMTQKVQVIAAVLHNPDLLIIDEPFANLDPVNSQLVRDIFLEFRNKGRAVIMTSHQMTLVEAMCDRIAMIHQGSVVLDGTVAEVRRQFAQNMLYISGSGELYETLPGVSHIDRRTTSDWYLTLTADAQPHAILRALTGNGHFTLDHFEVAMPTLDEIFVQVVRDSGNYVIT
jgi:ABC-2 type transport system ATP-binding protein